jgi:hypothetical protein
MKILVTTASRQVKFEILFPVPPVLFLRVFGSNRGHLALRVLPTEEDVTAGDSRR